MTVLVSISGRFGRSMTVGFLSAVLLSSCAAAPFLVPVAFEFARNLFQTGLQNYGSKHRDNLSNLVNRLSSPYMQGLPPVAMTAPGQSGMPGQPGVAPQQYPGQPAMPGQLGAYEPTNPYGNPATAYPGSAAAPNPYGSTGYPAQPGMNSYDPNNPYGAATQNPYGQQAAPYGSQPMYGQPANPYGSVGTTPYGGQNPYGANQSVAQNPYGQPPNPSTPYGTPPVPYGTPNPYGSTQSYATTPGQQTYDPNNPYGSVQSPYGQSQSAYGQQPGTVGVPYGMQPPQNYGTYGSVHGGAGYGGPPTYGQGGIYPRSVGGEPVAVDVAMIRQKYTVKGKEVVLMNDGEVLKDGGAEKEAGDRFKIVVRTNCDCYLYIMTIDGSGWAEPVFPVKDGKTHNPVKKDQEYAFPEDGHWFTLDQVKGVETFFVVASANRRRDLEESIAQLAEEKRPNTTIVAKVDEPPIIPRGVGSVQSRGVLKVQDDTGATLQVTPVSYAASQSGQDVTVTRWFKHE
jgi:hypothetical protein